MRSALPPGIASGNGRIEAIQVDVSAKLITQMLPLALGMVIHHAAPRLARWIVKPVSVLANVLLLVLIGLIVATQYETLAAIRFRGWMGMNLLLLASLCIGWFCGGPDTPTRKAMAVTTATRNAAVALVIVTGNFAGTPAVTAVVAYGLMSTVGALACALFFGKLGLFETEERTCRLLAFGKSNNRITWFVGPEEVQTESIDFFALRFSRSTRVRLTVLFRSLERTAAFVISLPLSPGKLEDRPYG